MLTDYFTYIIFTNYMSLGWLNVFILFDIDPYNVTKAARSSSEVECCPHKSAVVKRWCDPDRYDTFSQAVTSGLYM